MFDMFNVFYLDCLFIGGVFVCNNPAFSLCSTMSSEQQTDTPSPYVLPGKPKRTRLTHIIIFNKLAQLFHLFSVSPLLIFSWSPCPVYSVTLFIFLSSHHSLSISLHRRRRWVRRSRFYRGKKEVCELRNATGVFSRHDDLHFLPAAGHDQRHLQSRDVRLADVLTLHLLRVSVCAWPHWPAWGLQGPYRPHYISYISESHSVHQAHMQQIVTYSLTLTVCVYLCVCVLQVSLRLLPDPIICETLQGCVPHVPPLQQNPACREEKML